jgi:hypothetical protein
LQAARFDAVAKVTTQFFFFLDDDDDLPDDYLVVLDRCMRAEAVIAYTDELVRHPDGREERSSKSSYSPAAHMSEPQLVHHLVLCRTREAQAASKRLPRGHFCPHFMLYWELAKGGAAHVPEIGYVWNRNAQGMHLWPSTSMSQMRALLWAAGRLR